MDQNSGDYCDMHSIPTDARNLNAPLAHMQQLPPRSVLQSPYIVPMVAKAFEILDLLRNNANPLSVEQISKETHTALSSVYRIMRTMLAYGYVKKIGAAQYILVRQNELERTQSRAISAQMANRLLQAQSAAIPTPEI